MNRKDLIKLLSLARPFLMKQDFIPILTHFCFDKEHIIGYNDVAGIQISFSSELHCALPGELTIKLLETITDETLRLKTEETQITIHSGKSKLKLPTLPPDEFVFELPNYSEETHSITVFPSIKKGLKKCLECVGTDPSHPEHTGLRWSINKNEQTIYSTDNKTLSAYPLEADVVDSLTEKKPKINAVTPAFFCEQLISLSDYFCEATDPIKIYFTDEYAIAHISNECRIFTKLITLKENADFKSLVENLLDDIELEELKEPPSDLKPALERASLLIGSTISDISKVKLSDNELKLITESQYGNADDSVSFEEEFKTTTFKIKPQLIQRGFRVTEKIKFTPNLIIMTSNDGFLHLVTHSNTST